MAFESLGACGGADRYDGRAIAELKLGIAFLRTYVGQPPPDADSRSSSMNMTWASTRQSVCAGMWARSATKSGITIDAAKQRYYS
jgi:hypothetical protein